MFEREPRSGSCEFMSQPDRPSNAGNPEGAANRGRRFLGYFLLAKQKKVTSCRATPDGVGLELENPRASPILRQAQHERLSWRATPDSVVLNLKINQRASPILRYGLRPTQDERSQDLRVSTPLRGDPSTGSGRTEWWVHHERPKPSPSQTQPPPPSPPPPCW